MGPALQLAADPDRTGHLAADPAVLARRPVTDMARAILGEAETVRPIVSEARAVKALATPVAALALAVPAVAAPLAVNQLHRNSGLGGLRIEGDGARTQHGDSSGSQEDLLQHLSLQ